MSESDMTSSLICGVEADLESCLLFFFFEDLRFLLFGVDASVGSGAEDTLARVGLVVPSAGETASLVVPVKEGSVVRWDGS